VKPIVVRRTERIALAPGTGFEHCDSVPTVRIAIPAGLEGSEASTRTPAGGLLAAKGAELFLREDETDRWIPKTDLRRAGAVTITQVLVSPDGKWIAIVATTK
jgi:hypothetical protein